MSAPPAVTARVQRLFQGALNVEPPSIETDVIETGLIDSLALVELLAAIEQEFDLELPLDELEIDNFRTVETIAKFVVDSGGPEGANGG
jgi:acyl carrier protein